MNQRRPERREIDWPLVLPLGGQPRQLPSPTDTTPERQTLVAYNVEGEAGEDWGLGRNPLSGFRGPKWLCPNDWL